LRHVQSAKIDYYGLTAEEGLQELTKAWKRLSLGADYSSTAGHKLKQKMGDTRSDGSQMATIQGELMFPSKHSRSGGGISCCGFEVRQYLTEFGSEGVGLLRDAFNRRVQADSAKLVGAIKDRLARSPERFLESLFDDYQEAEEYRNAKLERIEVSIARDAEVDLRRKAIHAPFTAKVTFSAEKMPPAGEGVFSAMDDRELNRWIEGWASYAPENFHMDGETDMSSRELFRHYRDQWRKLSPRRQQQKYTQLHSLVR
jgi:hypothetical protein